MDTYQNVSNTPHDEFGKIVKAGETIQSDEDLEKKFQNKFKKLPPEQVKAGGKKKAWFEPKPEDEDDDLNAALGGDDEQDQPETPTPKKNRKAVPKSSKDEDDDMDHNAPDDEGAHEDASPKKSKKSKKSKKAH